MQVDQNQRLKLLFEPCETEEELRNHLKAFLKIELPDCIVDEDSTISPFGFLWQVYHSMFTNEGPMSHVVAASRNSAKTLNSAILHFYALIHARRDILHVAATYDQSVSCINYLNKFLKIPELASFSSTDNARLKSLSNLPPNSFTNRTEAVMRIAIANLKGSNSQRCSLLILDELDLVPMQIVSEVMGTTNPTPEGFEPITICLSSRKTNDGAVQLMMNDAANPENGIKLHKWSIADWMKKCPEETHKPELPRKKALLNLDTLQVIWDETHQAAINLEMQTQYKEINAYAGCETCPAFVACQARAPKQTSNSKMLRTIRFVGNTLRRVRDAGIIISQYLNLKPETTGIIFKTFSRSKHLKDSIEFYKYVTGRAFNPQNLSDEEYKTCLNSKKYIDRQRITPSKEDIYYALRISGWEISYGIDFGYSPAPAVCVVGAYHRRKQKACVFHVEYANGYDNRAWAEYVATNIWPKFPGEFVAPDLEDPASPSYLSKYKIPCINTKPHRIETGVSQLRGFLWNVAAQESQFAILNDPQEESGLGKLVEAFEKWARPRTPTGYDHNRFADNEFCDFIDPTRYLFAPYVNQQTISISAKQPNTNMIEQYRADLINMLPPEQRAAAVEAHAKNQLEKHFKENFGLEKIFEKENTLKEWESVQALNRRLSGQPDPPKDESVLPGRKSGIKISF